MIALETATVTRLRFAKPRVFLDLDGVMADFDGYFPELFGYDHREVADDLMWADINGYGTFFRDLPPCAGAVSFFHDILHLKPTILTACPFDPERFADIAEQKRGWVNEWLGPDVPTIFVPGSKHKQLYMHHPGDILIDDFAPNIKRWNAAGGRGVHHLGDFGATRAVLNYHLETP